MKRAALYLRVSTPDQNLDTQMLDLQTMASQRRLQIVAEYSDKISGAKARRPGLDQLMADARRGKFDVLLIWAFDRIARSTRHFLEILDELNHLNIEFISFRENIDTGGPLGRAMIVIIGAIAELERNLIKERVKAGMRRARFEGRRIGRDLERRQLRLGPGPRSWHEPERSGQDLPDIPCQYLPGAEKSGPAGNTYKGCSRKTVFLTPSHKAPFRSLCKSNKTGRRKWRPD